MHENIKWLCAPIIAIRQPLKYTRQQLKNKILIHQRIIITMTCAWTRSLCGRRSSTSRMLWWSWRPSCTSSPPPRTPSAYVMQMFHFLLDLFCFYYWLNDLILSEAKQLKHDFSIILNAIFHKMLFCSDAIVLTLVHVTGYDAGQPWLGDPAAQERRDIQQCRHHCVIEKDGVFCDVCAWKSSCLMSVNADKFAKICDCCMLMMCRCLLARFR